MSKVVVVGSINMDLVAVAGRFPAPGETILGERFVTVPGGKGANQAVAASRLGAEVSMVGKVGRDGFGDQLLAVLQREGVDTRHVGRSEVASGVAMITVSGGENSIVVVPGANHALLPADIAAAEAELAAADVILTQLEIPLDTVRAVLDIAARHGVPVILNPAPAQPLPADLLQQCALITPNEHELATVLGRPGEGMATLLPLLPGKVVMTHGSNGAWHARADGSLHHQPGFAVAAVDSTGAGDTFNGALAAFLPQGLELAMRHAAAAGALSVTRLGAQAGMPQRSELQAFMGA
ncbi:ribokinase [Vogesella sp. LIG4]|uniref:ribokinase n=1 Tax=Vogesella sp. LIG4 TaxID=1192162 RepID=UPI00081FC431|nr:ribokinase [Vogesella sp. LIG4]SCK21807.1 ribokinase [Vogesella sp. LIG4]